MGWVGGLCDYCEIPFTIVLAPTGDFKQTENESGFPIDYY